MIPLTDQLSIRTLFVAFRGKIILTWSLTLLETALFALLPLLIGKAIDGLLEGDMSPFFLLLLAMAALLVIATGRRVYDTRAYGTMRVELSNALAERSAGRSVSVVNARISMGRELVGFLETTAPDSAKSVIQLAVSVVILLSFYHELALAAGAATVLVIVIYSLFAPAFFALNHTLNERAEGQVTTLESRDKGSISSHFLALRKAEVQMSDTESVVYGVIFFILLSLLAFNLWFSATQSEASPGQLFSIVSYSFKFVESAVALPMTFQSLTRLKEITERINRKEW
jgi:hypothetical protein